MEYRKVENLFGEVLENVTEAESLIEKPYTENQCGDDIRILQMYKIVMKDGTELEHCFWAESDMYFIDISIDKNLLGSCGKDGFLKYLAEKGFYLENVQEAQGTRWRFCGPSEKEGVYRISYYQEEDEEEFAASLKQFLQEVLGARSEDDEM